MNVNNSDSKGNLPNGRIPTRDQVTVLQLQNIHPQKEVLETNYLGSILLLILQKLLFKTAFLNLQLNHV